MMDPRQLFTVGLACTLWCTFVRFIVLDDEEERPSEAKIVEEIVSSLKAFHCII